MAARRSTLYSNCTPPCFISRFSLIKILVGKGPAVLAHNQAKLPPNQIEEWENSCLWNLHGSLAILKNWYHSCYNHNNKRKLHFNDAAVPAHKQGKINKQKCMLPPSSTPKKILKKEERGKKLLLFLALLDIAKKVLCWAGEHLFQKNMLQMLPEMENGWRSFLAWWLFNDCYLLMKC